MPTRIVFAAGDTLLVHEEAPEVVKRLQSIAPASADLLQLTRAAGHADPGTYEGKPVYVRPTHVLYVTPS
jgi:hypothetical protein